MREGLGTRLLCPPVHESTLHAYGSALLEGVVPRLGRYDVWLYMYVHVRLLLCISYSLCVPSSLPATQYDPETELKRLRKEKEAKIKKFEEARKKKKQKESEWTFDSSIFLWL